MHRKAKKISYLFLTVFLCMSGFYFEAEKVESLSECASVEDTSPCLSDCRILDEDRVCTPDMWETHRAAGAQKLSARYVSKEGKIKIFLDFRFFNFFSPLEEMLFAGSWKAQIFCGKTGERITNFIHRSDGKKRMEA